MRFNMNDLVTVETYEQTQAQVSIYSDVSLYDKFYKIAEGSTNDVGATAGAESPAGAT